MSEPTLAIVWHSRTGAAQAMAQAAARGAMAPLDHTGGNVRITSADQATPAFLLAASGYLFVCPENLGTMSGMVKDMFDRAYYPLIGQLTGRPYATIIAAGSDGLGAQAQIDRIVTGWRLRRVAPPLVLCLDAQTPQAILAPKQVPPAMLERCAELGATLLSGMALSIF